MKNLFFISESRMDRLGFLDVSCLNFEEISRDMPIGVKLFLVDASDMAYAEKVCQAIRIHPTPAVYLRPIVLVTSKEEILARVRRMADAQLSLAGLSEFATQKISEETTPINDRLEMIPEYHKSTDTNIGLRIIRYLYTRRASLDPLRCIDVKVGYSYPEVECYLRQKDESVLQVLDFLESQSLLESDFFEKSHHCNRCHCAFLNFLETCPHCHSANLATDDLIHHFHCAYMGSEQEYLQKGRLICPKCERELRHIGVDFDKPSTICHCNHCRKTTQEPVVETVCFNCGSKTSPEDLVLRTIKKFRLTALGENSAIYGMESLFAQILGTEVKLLPYQVFKTYMAIEHERIRRYGKSKSCLVLLQIKDLDSIYVELGERVKEIFSEMSAIIKAVLRSSDIIAAQNESTFLILLIETEESGAKSVLERLQSQFTSLFENNLKRSAAIRTGMTPLLGDQSVDDLIAKVLAA